MRSFWRGLRSGVRGAIGRYVDCRVNVRLSSFRFKIFELSAHNHDSLSVMHQTLGEQYYRVVLAIC